MRNKRRDGFRNNLGFTPLETGHQRCPTIACGNLSLTGFTLVEIMVVVGVVIIILTLALPSMLRSRMNANETASIGHCRLISNSCQSYYTNVMPHEYPESLEDLIEPVSDPPYIDSTLASDENEKSGYRFNYRQVNAEAFILRANPTNPGRTGTRYFFVDETGIITTDSEGPADSDDPPVAG